MLSGVVAVSFLSGVELAAVAKQTCFPFLRSVSQIDTRFFLISNVLASGFLHRIRRRERTWAMSERYPLTTITRDGDKIRT